MTSCLSAVVHRYIAYDLAKEEDRTPCCPDSPMTDSAATSDVSALLGVMSSQQTARAFLFASLTVTIYDHVLLLPLEIPKVWKANWTLVKTLYIVNRIINWLVVILSFASQTAFQSL